MRTDRTPRDRLVFARCQVISAVPAVVETAFIPCPAAEAQVSLTSWLTPERALKTAQREHDFRTGCRHRRLRRCTKCERRHARKRQRPQKKIPQIAFHQTSKHVWCTSSGRDASQAGAESSHKLIACACETKSCQCSILPPERTITDMCADSHVRDDDAFVARFGTNAPMIRRGHARVATRRMTR
jgi:hypothetical protein